jgi:YVTN family beta-propeller protein
MATYSRSTPVRLASASLVTLAAAATLAAPVPARAAADRVGRPAATAPTLYVVNEGGTVVPGTVTPIDTATGVAGTPIKVGGVPFAIAITPNGKTAYVTDISRNVVTPISTATNSLRKPIKVGVGPFVLAMTPNGKAVYVANDDSSTVTPISAISDRAGRPIRVGSDPGYIAVSANGKTVYTVGLTELTAISTATNKARKPVRVGGGTHGIAISPDSRTVYVSDGDTLLRIDAATLRVTRRLRVGSDRDIVLTPDGRTLYAFGCPATGGTMTPIPTATLRPDKPVRLGFCSAREAFSPDGKTMYIVDSPDGLVFGQVIPISTATSMPETVPITVGEQPGAMVVASSGAGSTLYVLNTGSGSVTPISTATYAPGTPIPVGYLPTSLAVAP